MTARGRVTGHRGSGLAFDAAIASATFAATMGLVAHGGFGAGNATHHTVNVLNVALAAGATMPLLAWRRNAPAVLVLTTLASAAIALLGYAAEPPPGPTVALYLLASSRTEASPWTVQTTAVVAGLFALHVAAFGIGHGAVPAMALVFGTLLWAVAWFAGDRARLRHAEIAELARRAQRSDEDAERERRLAAAEERARIARDLHDSAGHAINVIAVHAGAARLLHEQDPKRAREAMATIEEVARQTVREIDQIVHSLRIDEREHGLAPGLAALDTLVARHAAFGMPVGVSSHGAPPALAGQIDEAAYRILQEALTNAARHGCGAVRIDISFGSRALELTVRNPVSADPRPAGRRAGHGLVGMRERAAMLGGTLRAGIAGEAFEVRATLPYRGGAA
jgi:signal transduction histidine kinase